MTTFPTIHLNGTSRDELIRQLSAALVAIGSAREALAAASPNARDYYPQGTEATRSAYAEHRSRLERLLVIEDELNAIAGHVVEARRQV